MAQTAVGASKLHVALAGGADTVTAGKDAFAAGGLGCARCHGDLAEGLRAPPLALGREMMDFRPPRPSSPTRTSPRSTRG